MKKTVTINLNSVVFYIDEDAYNLLNEYLHNLNSLFSDKDGNDEIIEDIEARIEEILSEKICGRKEVITIKDVEEIIEQLGQPEEIDDSDRKYTVEIKQAPATSNTSQRKLYRLPNDKIIGGVCSGIAAYLDVDATWVRLIAIVLSFITLSFMVSIYIILWIIVPEVKSATDMLVASGKEVTIDNVGKAVKDTFGESSVKTDENKNSSSKRFADGLVVVFGAIFKTVLIILAISLVPVLAGLTLGLVGVIIALVIVLIGQGTALMGYAPFMEWDNITEVVTSLFCSIGAIFSIGIPLFVFVYLILRNIMKVSELGRPIKYILLILWIIGLCLMGVTIALLSNY